ncbi:unnamed protein product, partial [Amoebophrya sp. A25]|eukprot:GSA25T00020159001.1
MIFLPRGQPPGAGGPGGGAPAEDPRSRYSGLASFLMLMMFLSLLVSKNPKNRGSGSSDPYSEGSDTRIAYPWDKKSFDAGGETEVVFVGPGSESATFAETGRPPCGRGVTSSGDNVRELGSTASSGSIRR